MARWCGLALLLAPALAGRCQLQTVPAAEMSLERFRREFLGKKPVLVEGGAQPWMQGADWRLPAFLERFGGHNVTVRHREKLSTQGGFAAPLRQLGIRELLRGAEENGMEDLLAFENVYTPLALALRSELDWSALPTYDVRMKTIVSLGSKVGGLALHWHEESWLAQLAGRKLWLLHSPADKRPLLQRPACEHLKKAAENKRILRCIARESDLLYLPDAWWHATCNLDSWTLGFGGMLGMDSTSPKALSAVVDDDVPALKAALKTRDRAPEGTIFSYLWNPELVTPHHVAAMTGSMKVLEALDGLWPGKLPGCLAHTAAYYGHLDMLRWLHKRGADLRCRGERSGALKLFADLPPLFVAAKNGHLAVLRWLAEEAGMDALQLLPGLGTALTFAAMDGQDSVADWLLAKGGDSKAYLSAKDGSGRAAARIAREAGHLDLARLLEALGDHPEL